MNVEPRTRRAEAIDALAKWLVKRGVEGAPVDKVLEGFSQRLLDAGVSIMRVHTTLRAIHPVFGAVAHRWHRDRGTEIEGFARNNAGAGRGWIQSPLYHMLATDTNTLHIQLRPGADLDRFPVLQTLRNEGGTDYFASRLAFARSEEVGVVDPDNPPEGMMISWLSDSIDGFTDQDIADLQYLLPFVGLTLKSQSNRQMAQDLMATYLGQDAGKRVMSGDIQRGSVETVPAVILYFDLKGFTQLSETLTGPEIIDMLNDYFAAAVSIVEERGGNVLKFMGDGLLAIFSLEDKADANLAALDAVTALRDSSVQVSERRRASGLSATGLKIALHSGDVQYGNIGAPHRLDFTVIGPAVNTAARILGMCNPLDQNIVISARVARPAMEKRRDLVSLGQYRLRGVSERQELFTLD